MIVDPITGITLKYEIRYSVSSKFAFLDYYTLNGLGKEYVLYDMSVYYERKDISSIEEIYKSKTSLLISYIIAIVLAGVNMILIVVGAILYRVNSKVKRSILK